MSLESSEFPACGLTRRTSQGMQEHTRQHRILSTCLPVDAALPRGATQAEQTKLLQRFPDEFRDKVRSLQSVGLSFTRLNALLISE